MTATAAEALELALWLHRAPARRAALAGRPLPDGIGQLLRVAGGAADQVAAAARITGEDEATVLEAVRFYLQQILFHDEADAYRMLGLRPDASQAQAREHHRLLQQWLHPDRRGHDQWETVYATRVNQAWTHLRTRQARDAYDASLAARPGADARGSRHGGEPRPDLSLRRQPAPRRNHSRNLTLVVLFGCAALLALIALRTERPPEWMDERAATPQPAPDPASPLPDGAALAASLEVLASATAAEAAPTALVPADPPPPPPASPAPALVVEAIMAANIPRPAAPPAAIPVPALVRTAPAGAAEVAAAPTGPTPVAARPVAAAPAAAAMVANAPAPPLAALPIPDALDRMRQARTRAHQVLAYLGDPTAVQPPVWNDLATAESAKDLRAALLARLPAGARLDLHEPQWRLSPDGARLESAYIADVHGGGGESGRLALDFVWREDRLLVRDVSVEPR